MPYRISPEILAPAGSFESADAACCCGADAVYFGGTDFSARAGAENFSDEEIKALAKHCHLRGVAVHRALNTVVFDSEIERFVQTAVSSARAGVDAFIVQDTGCADILRRILPGVPLHASTQMTIHTAEGALAARDMGFSRVVPARELSEEQIKLICDTGVETEVFVHGALCMCVSGQCYMSALIGSRSANRGCCAQACRLPFSGKNSGTERFDLSLKDMSYIGYIPRLFEMGVSSFKIEGRMKRPEYVAAAVTACRDVLNGRQPDMKTLGAVFSRSGFTDGYLTGNIGNGMFGFRRKEDVTAAKEVLPALRKLCSSEKPRYKADMHAELRLGAPSLLTMSCNDISVTAEGDPPQKALNRPIDAEFVSKQLSKLGSTVYYAGNISVSSDNDISISAASLNELRRNAVSMLNERIISENTPVYDIFTFRRSLVSAYDPSAEKTARLHIRKASQLGAALANGDLAVLPSWECLGNTHDISRIIAAPPRFVTDEKKLFGELSALREMGYERLYCGNIAHIRIGKALGYSLSGGFGLNVTNSYAAAKLADMGLSDITLSFEMKLSHISGIKCPVPAALAVFGKLPLMAVRNCPVRYASGCKNCTHHLTDRTGRSFPVLCSKNKDYSEIFNCDTLFMCDRLDETANIMIYDYFLGDSSPAKIADEMKLCRSGKAPSSGFTRGLYYRGISNKISHQQ